MTNESVSQPIDNECFKTPTHLLTSSTFSLSLSRSLSRCCWSISCSPLFFIRHLFSNWYYLSSSSLGGKKMSHSISSTCFTKKRKKKGKDLPLPVLLSTLIRTVKNDFDRVILFIRWSEKNFNECVCFFFFLSTPIHIFMYKDIVEQFRVSISIQDTVTKKKKTEQI